MLLDTQWTKLSGTAAGTTVISDRNCYMARIIFPGTATGTAIFYDTRVATGTTAGNQFFTIDQNKIGTAGGWTPALEVGARMNNGITAVVSGTVNMFVIWG